MTRNKFILIKVALAITIFFLTAIVSTYFYVDPPGEVIFLLPGLFYTSATIIVFVLMRQALSLLNCLAYYFLMLVTYYAMLFITIYTASFAFIVGIFTAGIGALITFVLTQKFITKRLFNQQSVFIIGGLSFLITDIFLFSFNAISDKSPADYIFNLGPSPIMLYGEAIFFWQLFVGIKLVITLQKTSDGAVHKETIVNERPGTPGPGLINAENKSGNIIEILGDKITDIKMYYEAQGENGWLDTVLTYIFLEKNGIINFPFAGDVVFNVVTFDTRAEPINEKAIPNIIGASITDIYFPYNEAGEPDIEWLVFIELSNGFVIHENRMAPGGTGAANLFLYTNEQFQKKLEGREYDLRSLRQMLAKSQAVD